MKDYTTRKPNVQETFFEPEKNAIDKAIAARWGEGILNSGYIILSSGLPVFKQDAEPQRSSMTCDFGTRTKPRKVEKETILINGHVNSFNPNAKYTCPECGRILHRNGLARIRLSHLPIGGSYTSLMVSRPRLRCSKQGCSYIYTFDVDFKESGHCITTHLANYMRELLAMGLTLKEVSLITGVNQNTVKDIDKKRLQDEYTVDGNGVRLKPPTERARHLGIDEFKLHNNRKYATVIMDLDTGHVLYLAHTKQKKVVYDFMDFVGDEWMRGVEAVASDMNADYGDAFRERYPAIKVVYDHFHIVKNFNEKVINEVKKSEIKRLMAEGDVEAASSLKGSKYILMSGRDTLRQKDKDGEANKVLAKAGVLFNGPEVVQGGGNMDRYMDIILQNDKLFTADLVKEKLRHAYEADTELKMKRRINSIIWLCESTEDEHFLWFAKLLRDHYDGIISHATYHISSGRVEGTNQMIKTLRRKSYGFPDDEYFFLKIMDASRG